MKNIAKGMIVLMSVLTIPIIGQAQDAYVQDHIGIQLYSLRNQFKKDVPKTLAQIKAWGFTVVEGGVDTYGMEDSEFAALLKTNGLHVISADASFEELRDMPKKTLARAKTLGASYVMCAWIPHNGDDFTIEDTKNAITVFNKAGKLLKESGLTLVYHPHGYEFRPYEEGTLFDYMAENAENFDFEMDVYWIVHGGADPMELFERYPNKFKLMHLKDMKKGTVGNNTGHGDVEDNVVLGTGMIDIKGLLKKGKELGVTHMFIEDESSKVIKQVPESLAFLKSLE